MQREPSRGPWGPRTPLTGDPGLGGERESFPAVSPRGGSCVVCVESEDSEGFSKFGNGVKEPGRKVRKGRRARQLAGAVRRQGGWRWRF